MTKTELPLSKITSLVGLSKKLGINERTLATSLRRAPAMYREIHIKKKDGTPRVIRAPANALKIVQRAVLDEILVLAPLPKSVYGFGRGKGIVDNARIHSGSPYLLNVDIKNFFPSVHFRRVQKIFMALGATMDIAITLTKLTTLEHSLPQGAPTSPYLAALALKNLDHRLAKLCTPNRLTYSRYFDDITISGGKRAHKVLETVEKIVEDEGYKIHRGSNKLRLSGPGDDKLVTGIIIKDGKLEAPNIEEVIEYVYLLKHGGLSALKNDNPLKEQMSLRGKINFIRQIDPKIGRELSEDLDRVGW